MTVLPHTPPHTPAARSGATPRRLALAVVLGAAMALAAVLPGSAGAGGAAGEPPLIVLAAGDLRGEIQPCGCSPEGQMGGLPRRLSYLEQQLAAGDPAPLLVDLGNNFPEPSAQGREKIALIRDLLRRFAPQAVLPGPGELALGAGALDDGLPYVLSNEAGGRLFAPSVTVPRAGRKVALYGYLAPGEVYQGVQVRFRLRPVDAALLADLRQRVRAAGADASVLLFRGSDAELAALAGAGLFDLIVAGNPSGNELQQVTERPVAGARIPQVPTKGQGVLRLALPGAGAPGRDRVDVDWLTERWPDHPAAAPVFAAYDEHVKALFFARLETQQRQTEESPYAGAAACQACHLAQHAVWATTRHSHAVATLVKVGKQYDPECLACHVVGLERRGFLSEDLTPQLANVQCENCHGPARAHAAMPTQRPGPVPTVDGTAAERPGQANCRTCHVGSHSPNFDFAVYWPKIAHPNPPQAARH